MLTITSCSSSPDSTVVDNTGYIEGSDGVRLFYRIAGAGSDTVVVVHGGPGAGMDAVRLDFGPLSTGRTVIYYDQRGGGKSTLPTDTTLLGAHHHVGVLEAVRQYFGFEQMDVVAHSFGSIIVAEYATLYPHRLRRIVFVGATGPRRSSAGALARGRFVDADTSLLREMYQPMSELLSGTADNPVAACEAYREAGAKLAESLGEPSVEGRGSECLMAASALSYYFRYTAQIGPASVGKWDYTTTLGSLKAPLLVIYGARDSEGIAVQREWMEAVDSARLLAITEAGKAVHVERPESVFEAINAFLGGRWPADAEQIP
ncbi:MAG TPA: alpha/beta hydrolase [Rhodothermales bacterium]|nr:alpha/beta hydrolase [Rhodothermales bacterium]